MALTTTEEALVRQLLDQQAAILSLADAESTIISKLGATKVTLADLSAAVAIDDADLLLIRQGTTEKSVSGAIVKSYGAQSDASTTVKGIVELATSAETQTGTDAVRAVTPAGLASVVASETLAGLVEIATAAEAQAFTANKAIDGAKLAAALQGSNQSLSANGYQKLPGGLILQWGSATTSSVSFPISFQSAVIHVIMSINNYNSAGTPAGTYTNVTSLTASGFTVSGAASSLPASLKYIAIGY